MNRKAKQHQIILHASTLTVFSQSLMLIIKASLYVTKFVKTRAVCVACVHSNGVMKMAVYWILQFGENVNEKKLSQNYRLKAKNLKFQFHKKYNAVVNHFERYGERIFNEHENHTTFASIEINCNFSHFIFVYSKNQTTKM